MGVKQAPQLVAVQLRELVRDMRRRAQTLRTAAERIAMTRDVAIFCVAFHTMKRGFELSVAVASQVLQMSGGESFIFNFLFGKTLRNSSHAVVVKKNLDCREICAVSHGGVPTGGGIRAVVTRQGARIIVPKRFRRR